MIFTGYYNVTWLVLYVLLIRYICFWMDHLWEFTLLNQIWHIFEVLAPSMCFACQLSRSCETSKAAGNLPKWTSPRRRPGKTDSSIAAAGIASCDSPAREAAGSLESKDVIWGGKDLYKYIMVLTLWLCMEYETQHGDFILLSRLIWWRQHRSSRY